jgi:hypothetical protein
MKSDKFRGAVQGPCSTKGIRNYGIQRALLEKTKKLLTNAKSESRAFRGPKAGKSAYFTHPDFSAAKLGKSAQITRINKVYIQGTYKLSEDFVTP